MKATCDEGLREQIKARRDFRENAREAFREVVDAVCDHLEKVDEAQADSLFQLFVIRSELGRIAESLPEGCEEQRAELRTLERPDDSAGTEGPFTAGALKWLAFMFHQAAPPNYLRWPLFVDDERLDVTVSRHNGLSTDEMLAFERARVQRLEERIRELEAEANHREHARYLVDLRQVWDSLPRDLRTHAKIIYVEGREAIVFAKDGRVCDLEVFPDGEALWSRFVRHSSEPAEVGEIGSLDDTEAFLATVRGFLGIDLDVSREDSGGGER